ncbi:S4 domain-containing protein YaaA [Staphylococcus haemolyticus]|uniref:S4 domain protein YaaA n=2 Tax=Staphylococcus haemolyticus TaxID=1283 RepID=A0A028ZHC3_STAHA|nr:MULTISPECIES: S4 domain-containing protein YaaA [Bacilli]ECO1693370.1 S4 domain-containing protein YaaA [Listeria monocytogenes]KDP54016.1 S4 domain protein YaaA [Staphylococcus aureus subsp. aureus CO-98]KGF25543.1 RNA-binding protein [Staphylococcus haemolyticus DNF00585]OFL87804.1 RNA-binding protein [Staphylococcus sp. HMSC069D12]OFM07006.1 RNA-binding protein [Staphylococcus sp. HMSC074A11]OFM07778.1 RNA-binding protein [Staphylococcus sp. HMSC069D07]OFM36355.1 RNA-binding protein [S
MVQEVVVEGDITLGQFLKTEGIIESGGQAKWFLQDVEVLINGERETRRGKKLANQDRIDFPDIPEIDSVIIIHQGEQ